MEDVKYAGGVDAWSVSGARGWAVCGTSPVGYCWKRGNGHVRCAVVSMGGWVGWDPFCVERPKACPSIEARPGNQRRTGPLTLVGVGLLRRLDAPCGRCAGCLACRRTPSSIIGAGLSNERRMPRTRVHAEDTCGATRPATGETYVGGSAKRVRWVFSWASSREARRISMSRLTMRPAPKTPESDPALWVNTTTRYPT